MKLRVAFKDFVIRRFHPALDLELVRGTLGLETREYNGVLTNIAEQNYLKGIFVSGSKEEI
ncbi:hypothetical protein CR513_05828, partial [Mucuna pruriens]